MESENSKKFYDDEASSYDAKRWLTPAGQLVNAVQMEILKKLARELTNLKILEIAAGTGRFTKVLLEQSNSVTALDISSTMLEQLKQRLKKHPSYGRLQIIIGDARNMALGLRPVDVVVCFNALSHIHEHRRVLTEVYRVLKPGGLFLFNIPNYLSLYLPFGLYVNLRKKSVTRDVYTRWYSLKEILRDLMASGFQIEDVKGQLHMPTWTPSIIVPFIRVIDSKLRNGIGTKFAPILFVKARKL